MTDAVTQPPLNDSPIAWAAHERESLRMAQNRAEKPGQNGSVGNLLESPREPPALGDTEQWNRIIAEGRLDEFRSGTLLAVYDSRTGDTGKRVEEAIILHLYDKVTRILGRKLWVETQDKEDMVSDVWTRILSLMQDPSSSPALRTYFEGFVANRGLDARCAAAKHKTRTVSMSQQPGLEDYADTASHPNEEQAAISRIDLRRLVESIKNPAHRLAVVMYAKGHTLQEIAEAVGLTPETVSVWINTIRRSGPND